MMGMRMKVVIWVIVFGALVTVGAVWFRSGRSRHELTVDKPTANVQRSTAEVKNLARSQTGTGISEPKPQNPKFSAADYVKTRTAQLEDLARNNDSESLNVILSELASREPEIRKAAVEAAVQFGSRDAVPKLEDAALQTDDAKERAAIVEAIEFLKLPSLTEVSAAKERKE